MSSDRPADDGRRCAIIGAVDDQPPPAALSLTRVLVTSGLGFAAVMGVVLLVAPAVVPGNEPLLGYTHTTVDNTGVDQAALGVLRGTVTDRLGSPVAGAEVVVSREGSPDEQCPLRHTTRSGLDGQWLLPVCQLGREETWVVRVADDDRSAAQPAVDVAEGLTTVVDLVIG